MILRYRVIGCFLLLSTLWLWSASDKSRDKLYKEAVVQIDLNNEGFVGRKQTPYTFGSGGTNMKFNKWTGLYGHIRSQKKVLFGTYLDAAYAAAYNNVALAQTAPGGAAVSGGFCFEYDHMGRWIFQTGIGARFQAVANAVDRVMVTNDNVYDQMGYRYTLLHDFTNRYDFAHTAQVQMPILFGTYFGPCYLLGGVKLQASFWNQTHIRLLGSTMGIYEQYIGLSPNNWFQEMDNHGLQQYVPIQRTEKAEFRVVPDMLLSLEIGYEHAVRDQFLRSSRLGSSYKDTRVRIALFADWGMLNQNTHQQKNLYHIPGEYMYDFPEHEFHHIFQTTQTAPDKHIHNFYAGVKLTMLVGYAFQPSCRICHPFKSEISYR